MHDTGYSELVHWDDPEGWYGEGSGSGVQDAGGGGGKNTSDKMILIPSSFSCVVVPVWFCNWDLLIPSGEGGYLVLPLPC